MNLINASLIFSAPIFIGLLYLLSIPRIGSNYLTPTFKLQAFICAVAWTIALPLHLQFSGWAVTPGVPAMFGAVNYPYFNIYNIPVSITLFGVPYDQGFLNTNYMHAVAASLFTLTSDLFVKWSNFWQQAFMSSFFVTILLNVWKINEIANKFNGSPLDAQVDWAFQNIAIFATMVFLYVLNKYGPQAVKPGSNLSMIPFKK